MREVSYRGNATVQFRALAAGAIYMGTIPRTGN
jgi:hypothetical protein